MIYMDVQVVLPFDVTPTLRWWQGWLGDGLGVVQAGQASSESTGYWSPQTHLRRSPAVKTARVKVPGALSMHAATAPLEGNMARIRAFYAL
jgi:hypothetical protein